MMPFDKVPARIGWPLFIAALFTMSVCAVGLTVYAAYSDGGPQVIEDYYERAKTWDAYAARAQASAALGWQVEARFEPGTSPTRVVSLDVVDRDGASLRDLAGTLTLRRPHLTEAVATVGLEPAAEGGYQVEVPVQGAGLYDLELAFRRGDDVFETTIRKEVLR